ncbi:hypothetical protein QYE76_008999 [Lolium multiflorum]|uniref:Integrase catalytic domain-containing protein n=1 Tax=Lolium multiflorum TaxID=4521 RepID=A0AAD8TSS8_LOLMU|nr:hypothetical protein QYE76_008999 [Lolium multiflorum]
MMEFANQVQRKYDNKILAIRSNNGTEFKNYTLDEFLGEEGIEHQYSTPYTPQQNGVAERKNRTLIEAARTMMMEYKSNYNFWAEAISTACHATNRLYFRKGLEKTPYEILTGNKPNVSYFKVFGCKCYILVKDTRLSKFDSRAQEGIFVGYATDSHAYRVFNKSSGRVVESCDVTFDEDDRSLEERSASSNLYNNLKFNLNLKINLDIYNNNQVQVHLNKLKNNIHRKLVYFNTQHQVTKVKLQVLLRVETKRGISITFPTSYRSGGTPAPDRRAWSSFGGTGASRSPKLLPALCCPVARRWVSDRNILARLGQSSTSTTSPSTSEMADSTPVTYEDLTEELKKKYDEVKAILEANLIGSFHRTRSHGVRWKGFSLKVRSME